jgi:hypothetical protein
LSCKQQCTTQQTANFIHRLYFLGSNENNKKIVCFMTKCETISI